MDYKIRIIRRENCFRGFFRLDRIVLQHSLFAGDMSPPIQREVITRQDAVACLLYDPEQDAVVMIEQFRIGALEDPESAWVTELVAGFQEAGETPEQVLRREVQEETGLQVQQIEPIAQYYINPANTPDRTALFCGRVDARLADGVHGVEEEGEDIRLLVIPYQELPACMASGRISSATPVIAVQWLFLHRDRLRREWR